MQDITMEMLGSWAVCNGADAGALQADLTDLADSMLDIDDPFLVERRRRAADAADPQPGAGSCTASPMGAKGRPCAAGLGFTVK
ncbi:MAG: hypothetical protein EB824_05385 [Thaumarchaeota archaeon S15]|nr:MAG: hypothetical protein EB824_05385 [Thaumarchaeota archaeon S15]